MSRDIDDNKNSSSPVGCPGGEALSCRICSTYGFCTPDFLKKALPQAQFAEIRFDLLEAASSEELEEAATKLVKLPGKAIATCRRMPPQGWPRLERTSSIPWPSMASKILLRAADAGADFVDLEMETPAEDIKKIRRLLHHRGSRLILSYHDFQGVPGTDTLNALCSNALEMGADLVKAACMIDSPASMERLLSLADSEHFERRVIPVGMGKAFALESRAEALRRGALFTYAAPSESAPLVPGQPSLRELLLHMNI